MSWYRDPLALATPIGEHEHELGHHGFHPEPVGLENGVNQNQSVSQPRTPSQVDIDSDESTVAPSPDEGDVEARSIKGDGRVIEGKGDKLDRQGSSSGSGSGSQEDEEDSPETSDNEGDEDKWTYAKQLRVSPSHRSLPLTSCRFDPLFIINNNSSSKYSQTCGIYLSYHKSTLRSTRFIT